AWWAGGDGPARARACAEALRAPPAADHAGEAAPDLHLGLASGALWAARLGGWFGGWELLVGGAAVREAFRCAARAGKGEIVVGEAEEKGPTPADAAAGPALPACAAPGEPSRPIAGWHRALLPRIVRDRGAGGLLPELRVVSCLFARIDGLDESAPDAPARAQAAVFALHEATGGGAGSAGRLVLDDKGLV